MNYLYIFVLDLEAETVFYDVKNIELIDVIV